MDTDLTQRLRHLEDRVEELEKSVGLLTTLFFLAASIVWFAAMGLYGMEGGFGLALAFLLLFLVVTVVRGIWRRRVSNISSSVEPR